MENLTKQQLILLAILVSFVSSIATGIVTVSLLAQAPPAVTQTINRIVERTVETVKPVGSEKIITKETIVISEDDAVIGAIDTASKSIVRVERSNDDSNWQFVGFGIVANDNQIIAKVPYDRSYNYRATLSTGTKIELGFIKSPSESNVITFAVSESNETLTVAKFADISLLKLGQKVVAVGGEVSNSVDTGIISGVDVVLNVVENIKATIVDPKLSADSILINLSGEIVGVKSSYFVSDGYLPLNIIKPKAE